MLWRKALVCKRRVQYQTLFASNPAYGTADDISKDGCLALAKLGHGVWNQWRRDYPVRKEPLQNPSLEDQPFRGGVQYKNVADFSQHVFTETTTFDSFVFGEHCNFEGTRFDCYTTFFNCRFGAGCSFREAQFRTVIFDVASFIGSACFAQAVFKTGAAFHGSIFMGEFDADAKNNTIQYDFGGVHFENAQIQFSGCRLKGNVSFYRAVGNSIILKGNNWNVDFPIWIFDASFSSLSGEIRVTDNHFGAANFTGARVRAMIFERCEFSNANFSGVAQDEFDRHFEDTERKRVGQFSKKHGLFPDKFKEVAFKGCTFKGEADFSGREFIRKAIWTKSRELSDEKKAKDDKEKAVAEEKALESRDTIFNVPPIFHGAKLPQDCSFVHAQFPKTASGKEEYERSYRTLRLALAQHGTIREEQRFFQLEMAEELARIKGKLRVRYWLIRLYSFFGYGFSVQRPLLALLVVLIAMMVSLGFGFENGFALNLDWDGVCNAFSRLSCAISTLVPLLGSPKSCKCWQTIPVLTEIFKFCGYTLTFLVGLALRNHLKMK